MAGCARSSVLLGVLHRESGTPEVVPQRPLDLGGEIEVVERGPHVGQPSVPCRRVHAERQVAASETGVTAHLGVGRGTAPVLHQEHAESHLGALEVVGRVHRRQDVVGADAAVEALHEPGEHLLTAHRLERSPCRDVHRYSPDSSSTARLARTTARASAAHSQPRARPASRSHSANAVRDSTADTGPSARADMERLEMPRPTRTTASAGSAAASPHTPTGRSCCAPPRQVNSTRRSTAGSHELAIAPSWPIVRSAASVYCVRSLVPMEANAARARMGPALRAAEGTSTMTPAVGRPASRARPTNSSASATVETMGAITHTSAVCAVAARAIAVSWRTSTGRRVGDGSHG